MELTHVDSRIARERLNHYLIESSRRFATDWDRVTAVLTAVRAAADTQLAASGSMLGLPDDASALDIATALQLLHSVRREIDFAEEDLIAAALERGMSWEQLGAAYGKNSRQAMQQHAKRLHGRVVADADGQLIPLVVPSPPEPESPR